MLGSKNASIPEACTLAIVSLMSAERMGPDASSRLRVGKVRCPLFMTGLANPFGIFSNAGITLTDLPEICSKAGILLLHVLFLLRVDGILSNAGITLAGIAF